MIKIRPIILLVIVNLIFLVSELQAKVYKNALDSLVTVYQINQAQKAFDNLAYAKSVRKFEPLYEKGYLPDSVKGTLGRAYLNVSKTEEAENVFASINNLWGDDLFFYAQALKYNGKYAEADRMMARYLESNKEDSRAVKQNNALPKIEKILSEERYEIKEVDFNSEQSDFGAFIINNDLVFASAREIDYIIRRKYAWKETPYLNLFKVKLKDDGYSKVDIYSTDLKSIYHDGPIHYNADANELFLTRNNVNGILPKHEEDGINHLKLMISYKKEDGSWGKPEDLPFNSDKFSTGHACISKDGKILYFASDRPGGKGGSDIWYVKRLVEGWSEPMNMGSEINTEGDEMFPFFDLEDRLYFSSDGHLGLGGLDLFIAIKSNGSYKVKNMGYPINSQKDDFSLYLSSDGINGYFASNREGGKGDDDIYRFKILKGVNFKKQITSKLINKYTGNILKNKPVRILDKKGNLLAELVTNQNGLISTEVEENVNEISFSVNDEEYFPYEESVELKSNTTEHEIALTPRPFYGIYGNVFLLPDMTPIPEVTLSIEPNGGEKTEITSDQEGNFKVKLEPNTNYDLVFKKQLFFTKRVSYSTVGRDTGYVNLNEFMELEMEEAEVGKSIEIQILYDLGKWDIRTDAAKELDDMIQFLYDNPTIKIELGSHTDARGSASSNQVLSQRRAESAVKYMVERGINADRIIAKGYGETRLKNRCADGVRCSEEEHQANRRSEVTIVAR